MFLDRPKSVAAGIVAATLTTGGAAILLADFGASRWIFAVLLVVPATLGLPATLGVCLVASAWGRFEPAYGPGGFAVTATIVAWLFQWQTLVLLRRACRPGKDSK